ncbi:hypothetical protein ELB20_48 [Streptomyces phage phiELB20]|uniref:Uncharacterized protein n=1 Tax=Streptomyces phage phiELB20 TaxID=1211278 RepID=I7B3Q4_9CAUD|nr:hypothetical protein FDG59_gp36 [Streptomyces phage phiELB20]AFO10914.1 hypothetical protein ELB20_48 [Streptomyces phage phiELB20]
MIRRLIGRLAGPLLIFMISASIGVTLAAAYVLANP